MTNFDMNNGVCYNNLEKLLCIPSSTHLPVSIQGFFTQPCCCNSKTSYDDCSESCEKHCCKKKKNIVPINLTKLTPSTLFQCKSNIGITFTNSSAGPPSSKSVWNTDFVPISSFSNFSLNGLHGIRRVIIQNITNYNNVFSNYCATGPTILGNPLGKINNKLGLYEYEVCNDNFKFGPVHIGYDNWLQAIPAITQTDNIQDNCVVIKYRDNKCGDCRETKSYSVLNVPLQLRLIFMYENSKKTQVLNMTIYLLTCEGPCEYPCEKKEIRSYNVCDKKDNLKYDSCSSSDTCDLESIH